MKASFVSTARWLVFLAAALVLNFLVLSTLITSLKSDAEIALNALLWVERPTLANYSHVFAMSERFDFMRFIENSVIGRVWARHFRSDWRCPRPTPSFASESARAGFCRLSPTSARSR
jgi:hypothetical protein